MHARPWQEHQRKHGLAILEGLLTRHKWADAERATGSQKRLVSDSMLQFLAGKQALFHNRLRHYVSIRGFARYQLWNENLGL